MIVCTPTVVRRAVMGAPFLLRMGSSEALSIKAPNRPVMTMLMPSPIKNPSGVTRPNSQVMEKTVK